MKIDLPQLKASWPLRDDMNLPLDLDDNDTSIAVLTTCPSWDQVLPDAAAEIRRAVNATFDALGLAAIDAGISFLLADDDEIRVLNRDWRDQDKPTNVLSFPAMALEAGEIPAPEFDGQSIALGDVALAYRTVALEADRAGIPFCNHFDHLVVHGVLHLLGYDHQSDVEAELMEDLERQVLASLGVADPYNFPAASSLPLQEDRRT